MKPPPDLTMMDKSGCPYGLADAGRHWYIRIMTELNACGRVQLKLDQAVFVWHCKDNTLMGEYLSFMSIISCSEALRRSMTIISKLKNVFTIGLEETPAMKYLGKSIVQNLDGIYMDTDRYLKFLKEIDTTGLGEKSRKLDPSEVTLLKKLSGQLNWITT